MLCKNKGIDLIQIYEDDWYHKTDIIKSRISNLLNKSKKIYARKCVIKEVDFNVAKDFLNINHLLGSNKYSINLGLYFGDELVSIMTFSKPRKTSKYKSDVENIYELCRFSTKLNMVVVGGISKLLTYFKNNYNVDEIFSFSALEWCGKVYEKIGMKLDNTYNTSSFPYWYITGKIRNNKPTYNKEKLIEMGYDENKTTNEILRELKIYKIYGPGNNIYVWKRY